MSEPLWATGPGEILRHGINLLENDTDANRRLAMIAIDNSVELMLKTYISIPQRVTGLSITRRERDDICSGFPQLLDGIEQHASDKIVGINLGEVEWFHRLRNELYHQGNGLTVERSKVEVYAELAKVLFENLFDVPMRLDETSDQAALGEFMAAWVHIERDLAAKNEDGRPIPIYNVILKLHEEGRLTRSQLEEFREVQKIRNGVVHGQIDPKDVLNKTTFSKVKEISEFVGKAMTGFFL
jgi:hypothetical protein